MSLLWQPERFLGNSLVLAFGQRHVCAYEHVRVWMRLAHSLRNLPMQSSKHWASFLPQPGDKLREIYRTGDGKIWQFQVLRLKDEISPTHMQICIYICTHTSAHLSLFLTSDIFYHLSKGGKAIRHVREAGVAIQQKVKGSVGKGSCTKPSLPLSVCRPVSVAYAKPRAPSASPHPATHEAPSCKNTTKQPKPRYMLPYLTLTYGAASPSSGTDTNTATSAFCSGHQP